MSNKLPLTICLLFLLLFTNRVVGGLETRWARQVSPDRVLPEYPRPQMVRKAWMNLNGIWKYAIREKSQTAVESYDGEILVPFCVESSLSGVQKKVGPDNRLWYRREFAVPTDWKSRRVLLHFGAVDWEVEVWVNGQRVGEHRGGYDPFSFDVTHALRESGQQEIVAAVWDPSDAGTQPRGKQVRDPKGIWYTSVTGIWQTVWLEPVAKVSIQRLTIVPDLATGSVRVTAEVTGAPTNVTVRIESKGARDWEDHLLTFPKLAKNSATGNVNESVELRLPVIYPWSVDEPWLYDLSVALLDSAGRQLDSVTSYFGLRDIAVKNGSGGHRRLFLNNKEIFQLGPLDQGWWPDGLYTAPTDEALHYDIEVTKKLGFNMARKHVKVEPARWYYWCDKLGLLVWQDMPNGDQHIGASDPDLQRSAESARQFEQELLALVRGLGNHPSIVVWVPFNEGWGQYDTARITGLVKETDPRRLVINTSGWADRGVGDMNDMHAYPGPAMPEPESRRAVVLGEFGGLGLPVAGHLWQQDENWGYRGFETTSQLTTAYGNLFRDLQPLIRKGLAAAIYTQTTDVEIEVNGLMTYDREVVKIPFETISRINQGFVAPVISPENVLFLNSTNVTIEGGPVAGEVRYTTDGSEPTQTSPLYVKPLTLNGTTTIKARTFWPDGVASVVSTLKVEKAEFRSAPSGVNKQSLRPGLRYRYFEDPHNRWAQIPEFEKLEAVAEGIAPQLDLSAARRDKYIAMEFAGYLEIPRDGIYTFSLTSNDGSKLYIDDQLVIDHDFAHGMLEKTGKLALRSGTFPLRVEYFQGDGTMGLALRYVGPGVAKQTLPSQGLHH